MVFLHCNCLPMIVPLCSCQWIEDLQSNRFDSKPFWLEGPEGTHGPLKPSPYLRSYNYAPIQAVCRCAGARRPETIFPRGGRKRYF